MPIRVRVVMFAAILIVTTGCQSSRRSASGFRLPPGGNAERGKAAFLAFGCNSCHDVAGTELPVPSVRRSSAIQLGGPVAFEPNDGRLVRAIIYPSTAPAWHMPDYSDRMTVQQLTDLVAFLQPAYVVSPQMRPYPYHLRFPEH